MNIMDYEGLTLEEILKKQPDRQILDKLLKKEKDEEKRKTILDLLNQLKKS